MFAKFSKCLLFLAVLAFIFAACSGPADVSGCEGMGSNSNAKCWNDKPGESSSSTELEPSSSSETLKSSNSEFGESSSSRAALISSSSSSSRVNQSSSSRISSSSRANSSSSIAQSSSSKANSSSSQGGSTPMGLCTTKACIDNEINANYSRLGYTTKPTKVIALSFDDGPCTGTQGLLNALAKKEVKTTFFLIGSEIRGNKTAAQAIHTAGHELANHSDGYSGNPNQTSVQACSNEIKNITGSNPTLFRAPNVDYGNGAVDNVCKNLNLAMIDVSCWSNDYNGINSTQIRTNVKACAGDGKIVNLHEFNTAKGNDAAGIEGLIDDLRSAGYWILPVGQMAIYKNKTLVGGTKYSNF